MSNIIALKDYITRPQETLNLASEKAVTLVNETLGVERMAHAYEHFPKINPAFLEMRHPRIEYALKTSLNATFKVYVPRFAVYTTNSPICNLTVGLTHYAENRYIDGVDSGGFEGEIVATSLQSELPSILNQHLIKSFRTVKRNYKNRYYDSTNSEDSFEFTSVFNGLIPKQAKRNIKLAERLFEGKVYIIAEAENWDAKHVPTLDPLVIGCIRDECFLVDSFDCTPLEERVRKKSI